MQNDNFTPEQCRAARGLLGWSIGDLCERTGTTRKTVSDFENGKTAPQPRTVRDILDAFEKAGVEFIGRNAPSLTGGPGVRLKSIEPQHA
ncbi:helix-turn-helix transcriptional regulator [Azospirillum sp. Sh1]|uniref:helix-turn-helix domain-containing protein n=1 Tax=Azospirillum sp. Sh1 TaxID=2607285 RepID=UPI0011EC0730|nr:helix-turn-helix transcriptional regulator [Azospirillum sp. Sh1]KAA0576659.1 helix-turn-helix transcriptional regulator [Azospirillum sp. Sh1]